jgi:26S proteasome regulatory subunit N6
LQENICRIIEPYSTVETAHIASVMRLPQPKIVEKLSQMILDKKFHGILDAGAGCLIVYEDAQADETYAQALDTLGNMGRVVDALYDKAQKLGVAAHSQPAVKA